MATQPSPQDLAIAQEAVRARPKSAPAHLHLGELYVALGHASEGASELLLATRLDPRSEPTFRALARLFQSARYLDRETEALQRLADLGTRDPQVYLRLGQIYLQLDWLDRAKPALQRAIALAPTAAAPQLEMARYEFESGWSEGAVQRLQAAHRRRPENTEILSQWMQYLLARQEKEKAESLLREALRQRPNDPEIEPLLAYCLMRIGDEARLKEAVALLKKSLQTTPPKAETYSWLGRCYERLERPADAIVAYQHAVSLDPAVEHVTFALGRLYLRQKREQEGKKLLAFYSVIQKNSLDYNAARSKVRLRPDDPHSLCELAALDMRLRAYPRAAMEYRRALEKDPNHAVARAGLRKALLAAGRRTEAGRLD